MLKASVQWSDGNGIPQTICWDSNDPELWIIIIIDFPPQDIIIIGIKPRQFVMSSGVKQNVGFVEKEENQANPKNRKIAT